MDDFGFNKHNVIPRVNKMGILKREECDKWDMKRYHYYIQIGNEVFNYYGSAKNYEDSIKCIEWAKHNKGTWTRIPPIRQKTNDELENEGMVGMKIKLPTNEDVLVSALWCLVIDYFTRKENDLGDFLDEFGYSYKEGHKIYEEMEMNSRRLCRVIPERELEQLREYYQDF